MSLLPYPTQPWELQRGRISIDKSNSDESIPPKYEAFDVLRPRGPSDEGKVLPMFAFMHAILFLKYSNICLSL